MPPPAAVLSSFSVAVNFTLVAAFALMISVVLQQLPGAHSLGDVSVKALRFRSPGDCCVDGEGVGDNPSYCRAFTDTTEPDSDGTMMPCCWFVWGYRCFILRCLLFYGYFPTSTD
jgi:hypothetical protein